VGNLAPRTGRADICKLAAEAGFHVEFVWMRRHDKTGKILDRAHCFVQLAKPSQKHAAVEALRGRELLGRIINVHVYVPIEKREEWGKPREATAKPRASFHSPEHPTWRGEWQANEAAR